ncbi:MAG TPA: S8 family serine peptidase [Acidobacteriota bacterium]|nr:S8 family serine peptidase [Acidobacteriota bacterium]
MRYSLRNCLVSWAIAPALIAGGASAEKKIAIEKLDDLPRHTYRIDVKAVDLFHDEAALAKLAGEVENDLKADLQTYEIKDKTTLKDYYATLGTVALLQARYDEYLAHLESVRQLEDKEASRLMFGLFSRAYIKAAGLGAGDLTEGIRAEYSSLVNELPYETVEAEIRSAKGRAEMLSENLLAGIISTRIQPVLDQSGGEVSKDIAVSLLGRAYTVRNYLPYKAVVLDVLNAYLQAHRVEKPNIWTEREAEVTQGSGKAPVVVAIWDSGTDVDVFADRLWTNDKEIPDNAIDDDGNGFVDDVHGIAYTLHSDKTTGLMYPIGDVATDRPRLQRLMKGLTDIGSGVESEEASDLKKLLGSMDPSKVQPFFENIGLYGNYCHGTHVAGIAARGNPYIRLMTARITFDHKMMPEEPTVAQTRKDSLALAQTVQYFRDNGVRVVNMSWGGDLASVEKDLEASNAGGTPEERKALARQIFEIQKQGLFEAIKNAPEVLFVTSAGNTDDDVIFDEVIPSGFDLPNIFSVGAVDQAGEETSFTSFGKVDVYANGYEVLSYVPGGDEMKLSGTSQSSPSVAGLAAKLLALRPDLTPAQVRELIEKGADERTAGERTVRLVNPKRSMELLAAMD